jgi:hypothetical protein
MSLHRRLHRPLGKQDSLLAARLQHVESLMSLKEPLRTEVWSALPSWRRRSKASSLSPELRLQLLIDEESPEVCAALSKGLPTTDVTTAVANKPQLPRVLSTLATLEGEPLLKAALHLLERASTRRTLEWVVANTYIEIPWLECDVLRYRFLQTASVHSLKHMTLALDQQELSILFQRLSGCHADGLAARSIARAVTLFQPPENAAQLVRRTTRLGAVHEILDAWAHMKVYLPVELQNQATSVAARRSAQLLEACVEHCAANWLKHSPQIESATSAELAKYLDHVGHPVSLVSQNPAFPARLWPEVLANEGQGRALAWWAEHPEATSECIAAIMSNFYPSQFAADAPPEQIRGPLDRTDPAVTKAALLLLDDRELHNAVGCLVEAEYCDLDVFSVLPASIVLEHVGGDDVIRWFNDRLHSAREWEAFDALCRSNNELSIADALHVITRIN